MANKKKGSKAPALLLVVGLIAGALYYLKDFGLGFGLGGGKGSGKGEQSKPIDKPKASATHTVFKVAVQGEQCSQDGKPAAPCDAVCAVVAKAGKNVRVEIDAAKGVHKTVETLKACLQKGGVSDVLMVGDGAAPPPPR